jgi:hypothetical protein
MDMGRVKGEGRGRETPEGTKPSHAHKCRYVTLRSATPMQADRTLAQTGPCMHPHIPHTRQAPRRAPTHPSTPSLGHPLPAPGLPRLLLLQPGVRHTGHDAAGRHCASTYKGGNRSHTRNTLAQQRLAPSTHTHSSISHAWATQTTAMCPIRLLNSLDVTVAQGANPHVADVRDRQPRHCSSCGSGSASTVDRWGG